MHWPVSTSEMKQPAPDDTVSQFSAESVPRSPVAFPPSSPPGFYGSGMWTSSTALPQHLAGAMSGEQRASAPLQPLSSPFTDILPAIPQQPSSAALPLQPSAALPLQPSAALPLQPSAALPLQPSAALPLQPSAALTLQPAPALPLPLQPSATPQEETTAQPQLSLETSHSPEANRVPSPAVPEHARVSIDSTPLSNVDVSRDANEDLNAQVSTLQAAHSLHKKAQVAALESELQRQLKDELATLSGDVRTHQTAAV